MRADAEAADRNAAVRRAARAWRAAEAIDAPTLAAIEKAYADDRQRLGPALRTLAALSAFVAANGLLGILALGTSGERGFGGLLLVLGVALLALTDVQLGALKRRQAGAEAATALLGITYVTIAFALFGGHAPVVLLVLLALCAAAAWRWGYPLAAGAAAIAGFALLARLPGARWLWIVAGLSLPPMLFRASDSARLPPSLRSGLRVVALVALLGLYCAFHLASWDHGIVEELGDFSRSEPPPEGWLRLLSIAGTALVPLGVLAAGVRSRRSELLTLGVLLALASSVTLRFYVHVAPLWVVLSGGGLAVVLLGLGLLRFLRSGSGRERFGFTAEPLYGRAAGGLLEIAAALSSFSPAPQAAAQPGLRPGGGRYGGGGATGSY